MKKALLILSILSIYSSSFAQEAKPGAGKIFIAGSVGFSNTSTKPEGGTSSSTGNLVLAPSLGFFIDDNIAVGGRLTFSKDFAEKQKGGTTFGIGAFARYYKSLNENGTFHIFGEVALGFASNKQLYSENATTEPESTNAFGLGIAPGLGWYPGKTFAIEFMLPSVLSFSLNSQNKASSGSSFQIGASTLAQPVSLTVLFFIK